VIRDFRNIQCRDAVLDYDRMEWVTDEAGRPVTHWDGRTMQPHPVTGEPVPDERAQVPVERYVNPRRAAWPAADFVVGNPPFIGNKRMRQALGDGYVEALRGAWSDMPDSADYVMYWWHQAAELARTRRIARFGFITTNSVKQSFNRQIIDGHCGAAEPLCLIYAVPDHPWVDAADGAAVRIAMTVGQAGVAPGVLLRVIGEQPDGAADGIAVEFERGEGRINPDLTVGADLSAAIPLRANLGLAFTGMYPLGQGFVIQPGDLTKAIGTDTDTEKVLKPFVIARDLTQIDRGAQIIDFYPRTMEQARANFPCLFQWVLERVKPERDQNPRPARRDNWWRFAEPNPSLRTALRGLDRMLVVPRTAKWFTFQFVSPNTVPDTAVVAFALSDYFILGVLSSRVHLIWATMAGGRLGVGNDPRYQHKQTFNPFPFPAPEEPERERIRHLAEALDTHRKSRQALHPGLTMTGMYNVLEQLRRGAPLGPKDRQIHEQGLISVLRQLHDELDAAVLAAYGWEDLTAALGGGPVGSAARTVPPTAPRLGPDSDAMTSAAAVRAADPTMVEPPPTADAEADAGIGADALGTADPVGADRVEALILEHLVALNAERAAEERRGLIRWLRPDLQHPAGTGAVPVSAQSAVVAPAASGPKPDWPKTLPEQFQALRTALAARPGPVGAADLAQSFSRAPRARVADLLETLASLGHARRLEDGRYLPG